MKKIATTASTTQILKEGSMKTFRLPIVFMFMVLAVAQIAQAQSPYKGDGVDERDRAVLCEQRC
jgi:hypothetical protein